MRHDLLMAAAVECRSRRNFTLECLALAVVPLDLRQGYAARAVLIYAKGFFHLITPKKKEAPEGAPKWSGLFGVEDIPGQLWTLARGRGEYLPRA